MYRLLVPLLVLLLAAPYARAQHALPLDVLGASATEATGGTYTLRATVGEAAAGTATNGTYALSAGFWPAVVRGGGASAPALAITLTPLGAPITIPPQGGSFQFQVTVANQSGQSQSFQGWTEATLPGGNQRKAMGPQNLTLAAGATLGPITLTQQVPGIAPVGDYTYTGAVGTYPDLIIDSDGFPFTKAQPRLAATRSGDTATRSGAAREAAVTREAAAEHAGAAREAPPAARIAAPPLRDGSEWSVVVTATGEPLVDEGDLLVAAQRVARPAAEKATREAPMTDVEEWAVAEAGLGVPETFALHAPRPNPFTASIALRYDLLAAATVRLAVYDALGREVTVLVDEARPAGRYEAVFEAGPLPSGLYLARLTAEGLTQTRTITRLR